MTKRYVVIVFGPNLPGTIDELDSFDDYAAAHNAAREIVGKPMRYPVQVAGETVEWEVGPTVTGAWVRDTRA